MNPNRKKIFRLLGFTFFIFFPILFLVLERRCFELFTAPAYCQDTEELLFFLLVPIISSFVAALFLLALFGVKNHFYLIVATLSLGVVLSVTLFFIAAFLSDIWDSYQRKIHSAENIEVARTIILEDFREEPILAENGQYTGIKVYLALKNMSQKSSKIGVTRISLVGPMAGHPYYSGQLFYKKETADERYGEIQEEVGPGEVKAFNFEFFPVIATKNPPEWSAANWARFKMVTKTESAILGFEAWISEQSDGYLLDPAGNYRPGAYGAMLHTRPYKADQFYIPGPCSFDLDGACPEVCNKNIDADCCHTLIDWEWRDYLCKLKH